MEADVEARKRKNVLRKYRNEAIQVNWEPEYCIHAANCLRGLPDVFQIDSQPWIKVDAATADQIAAIVMTCPSGALSFERLDGGEQEPVLEEAVAEPLRNGPLALRGRVRVVDAEGHTLREATRVTLCRCGHSGNKPFCDMSHLRVGFRAE